MNFQYEKRTTFTNEIPRIKYSRMNKGRIGLEPPQYQRQEEEARDASYTRITMASRARIISPRSEGVRLRSSHQFLRRVATQEQEQRPSSAGTIIGLSNVHQRQQQREDIEAGTVERLWSAYMKVQGC